MAVHEPSRQRPVNLVVETDHIVLTIDQAASVLAIAHRLNAAQVTLYETGDGLRATVIEHSGARHLGVVVER